VSEPSSDARSKDLVKHPRPAADHLCSSVFSKEDVMQLGMIGLGRVGANIVRLTAAEHVRSTLEEPIPGTLEKVTRAVTAV
jgi:hypothetical protein